MEINETWDVGRLIELGGPLYNGMWKINDPHFPPFQLAELEMRQWCLDRGQPFQSYTQTMSMCVQCSTYLETGAHLYPEMEDVSEIGLDRLLLSALVLQVSVSAGEHVTGEHLAKALAQHGETINKGDAILVATGYDHFSPSPELASSPHFSYSAFELMLASEPAIIGSDMAAWYDGKETPSFFPMFLRSGSLLLAPLINLREINVPRVKLIVLPVKVQGACAAPARVVAILPAGN